MTKIDWIEDSKVKFDIEADEAKLAEIKATVQKKLQPHASAPGFRKGKVPLAKVESAIGDEVFKSEFLDAALNALFNDFVHSNDLRPLSQPQIEIKKFVPYTAFEFGVTVEVVGKIKLTDYTKIKLSPGKVSVGKKDVDEVIASLQKRMAEKVDVDRAAKDGDEAWIDFHGVDMDGKDVAGASGKDYPLALGSDTFIKGFEPEIVGMKKGDKKDFTVTFPKDYAHKPLANKDVKFSVECKAVKEVKEPKVDDEFAAKVGPFKTVDELREDIEKQVKLQKEKEADGVFKDQLLEQLIDKSEIPVPELLLGDQEQVQIDEFKQNLTYRGITFEDYLKQSNKTEEEFIETEIRPKATDKVKVGLALSEVAKAEKLQVTPEEIEIRKQLLKGQYKDDAMVAQLDAPEAERDIASRLLTEKTIDKLVSYTK